MLVNTYPYGQLGNQLTLFSYLIAFSLEYDITIVNTTFNQYAKFFDTPSKDLLCRFPPHSSMFADSLRLRAFVRELGRIASYQLIKRRIPFFSSYMESDDHEKFDLHDTKFVASARNGVALIWSWGFQDFDMLLKHASVIRVQLKPIVSIMNTVDTIIRPARDKCSVLIGVHLRQIPSETADHPDYRYFTSHQYLIMMLNTRKLFPEHTVGFVICSDTPQDLRVFKDVNIFLGPGGAIEDLFSLSQCHYIIGSPSTFSAWASFYGNIPIYVAYDDKTIDGVEAFRLPEKWFK